MNACGWCKQPARRTWCSRRCRQAAWRLRQRSSQRARNGHALRFAYADPPYPGMAWKFYRSDEVDHAALIARLELYDGWALSTSARTLATVLPLCPASARVCAWVKPIGAAPATYGLHNTWEPLIVVAGRRLRPGTRDWLSAQPARLNGDLIGRKPIAFCAWLFEVLGMLPGDSLDDLFPGTGIVARSWRVVGDPDDASPVDQTTRKSLGDPETPGADDASVGSATTGVLGAGGKPRDLTTGTHGSRNLPGRHKSDDLVKVAADPTDASFGAVVHRGVDQVPGDATQGD